MASCRLRFARQVQQIGNVMLTDISQGLLDDPRNVAQERWSANRCKL